MNNDEKYRSLGGVNACMRDEGDSISVMIDGLENNNEDDPYQSTFSWYTFSKEGFLKNDLTAKEYEAIGKYLVKQLNKNYKG